MTQELEEHFFRHEYGRLVARLSRRVGLGHLELVEDSVQSARLAAFESWSRVGIPENPSAWLFRVAHNEVVGELRQRARRERLIAERCSDLVDCAAAQPSASLVGDVRDDLLRMLFVCCDDAISVESQLVIALKHPVAGNPETFALLALMHLHAARTTARQDGSGGLLLLEEQDRSCWDRTEIRTGLAWLAKSAQGDVFSRYHAEAGIAAEHCLARCFEETRWERIVECYALLERVGPSALHTLNRAVAVAEWRGPAEGLAMLHGLEPPSWLAGSYMWMAVLADLHRRCRHDEIADRYRDAALGSAPSAAVRDVLKRRLQTSP